MAFTCTKPVMKTPKQWVKSVQSYIKTREQCQLHRPDIFIANFEQISHMVLVFPFVKFEQLNAAWVVHTVMHKIMAGKMLNKICKIENKFISCQRKTFTTLS